MEKGNPLPVTAIIILIAGIVVTLTTLAAIVRDPMDDHYASIIEALGSEVAR